MSKKQALNPYANTNSAICALSDGPDHLPASFDLGPVKSWFNRFFTSIRLRCFVLVAYVIFWISVIELEPLFTEQRRFVISALLQLGATTATRA